MFQTAPHGSGAGNTRLPRVNPSKAWCFTYFYQNGSDISTLEEILKESGDYIFGEEICPTSGKNHIQGYIIFKSKARPLEKIKIKGIHWEKAKGDKDSNIKYCSKEGKVHTNMKLKKKLIDPLDGLVLYKWQKEVLEIIKSPPDNRTIYWFWEKDGNKGKTSLAKHICMNYDAIYVNGKGSDIKCAIAELVNNNNSPDIVLFGYPRSNEDYVSYDSLEALKDGLFFSGKYESGMCMFNSPHVIVFANFEPNRSKLSIDRWKIKNIL